MNTTYDHNLPQALSAQQSFGRRMQISGALLTIIGIPFLCILGGQAALLRIVFPLISIAVGAFFLWRSKPLYVGLVFWLWFVTPFLGRMADFQGGWSSSSSIQLAPYIPTIMAGIPLFANLGHLTNRRTLPHVCAFAAILYGLIFGLTYLPLYYVLRALLAWLAPVVFGLFIYENRHIYPEIRRVIEKTFLYGVLVLGAYGIYQFFVLPDWDRTWLLNVEMNSFGEIDPMKIRAFSTMNAPTIFAATMACGLLLIFNLKGKLRLLAAACGFGGLLLTLSRASWLSFAAGYIYLLFRLGTRERFRLAAGSLACAVLLLGAAQVPAVKDVVWERFRTLTQPGQDVSFSARIEGHESALREIAQEPFGEGIGSTDALHGTEGDDDIIGPHDSTLLEFLYSLGWIGTFIYAMGLVSLVLQLFRPGGTDTFVVSAQAILIGYLAQCLLNSVLLGVLGFFVWTFASMNLAAADYAEAAANQIETEIQPAADCALA